LSRQSGESTRASTGTSGGSLRWVYPRIAAFAVAATVAERLLRSSQVGSLLLGLEASAVARMLELAGVGVIAIRRGVVLAYGFGHATTMIMTWECSSLLAVVAFLLFSLSIPGVSPGGRLAAALIYAPAIVAVNLFRILVVVLASLYFGVGASALMHNYLGSALILLAYTLLWFDWLARHLGRGSGG